jgi:hypothetical protein
LARPGVQWVGLTDLQRKIASTDDQVHKFLTEVCQLHAPRAESYAKRNAKWHDRTGNARNGLHGVAESQGKTHQIVLAHGVPYGIYLEVRFSGKYAIINPTIAVEGPEVMRTVANGLPKIYG